MEKKYKFTRNIRLRLVTIEDADFILSLRSDVTKNKYLSQGVNTKSEQCVWLTLYKDREQLGEEYYFVIESEKGERLGVVRLYDFTENSFCWGSWILKTDVSFYAAIESALSVYEFGFYELGFHQSHFDVRKGNQKVVAFHTRFGAQRIHEDAQNYYFKFSREAYEKIKKRYSKFFKIR